MFDAKYFGISSWSLLLNIIACKLGLYNNKLYLKIGVPAQSHLLFIAFTKILLISIGQNLTITQFWVIAGFVCPMWLLTEGMINLVCQCQSYKENMKIFYMWILLYSAPIGFYIFSAGTDYLLYNYIALGLGMFMILLGLVGSSNYLFEFGEKENRPMLKPV